jgi:pimeloyl-ACP methyl ester carboxylesterase
MVGAFSISGVIPTIERPATELTFRSPAGAELPKPTTVWFKALDGHWLNFKHLPPAVGTPDRGPVMLLHGTAVRANLFCPPMTVTLPALLSAAGFDVWMLNWRASIDLRTVKWNLDDAAVLDYPAAVAVIQQQTGRRELKALVHCQGSASFLMSILSGRLPDITTVVANSSGLYPVLRRPAQVKLPIAMATLAKVTSSFDSQFGLYAPSFGAKVMNWLVRATHHECNYAICKTSSFIYGMGAPTMWNHDNLDDTTHHWLNGEFGYAPVRLFEQIARCVKEGNLVSMRKYPEDVLNYEFGTGARVTSRATFHFVTGAENRCFLPEGMERTAAYFNNHSDIGPHTFTAFPGYGHMDVFFGKNAHVDVHPTLVNLLRGDT